MTINSSLTQRSERAVALVIRPERLTAVGYKRIPSGSIVIVFGVSVCTVYDIIIISMLRAFAATQIVHTINKLFGIYSIVMVYYRWPLFALILLLLLFTFLRCRYKQYSRYRASYFFVQLNNQALLANGITGEQSGLQQIQQSCH